jgi:hypothetical protein
MQWVNENDFECFANTGVNTPETMFPNSWPESMRRVSGLANVFGSHGACDRDH